MYKFFSFYRTIDKLSQTEELHRELKTEEDALRNLENENEILRNELRCLENKLCPLEQVISQNLHFSY